MLRFMSGSGQGKAHPRGEGSQCPCRSSPLEPLPHRIARTLSFHTARPHTPPRPFQQPPVPASQTTIPSYPAIPPYPLIRFEPEPPPFPVDSWQIPGKFPTGYRFWFSRKLLVFWGATAVLNYPFSSLFLRVVFWFPPPRPGTPHKLFHVEHSSSQAFPNSTYLTGLQTFNHNFSPFLLRFLHVPHRF